MRSSLETVLRQDRLVTISLVVLAGVAMAAALAYTRAVMIPFVLAIFISYLVFPLLDLLTGWLRMPRWLAVIVALMIVLALVTLLALLITTSTRSLFENADLYRDRLTTLAARALSVLDRFDIDLGQERLLEGLRQFPLLSVLRNTAGTVVGVISKGFLVLLFVIYMVIGRRPNRLRRGIYAEIDFKIRRYVTIKSTVSAATGILVGVILSLFGLDLALVFGVMAFLLNFIPSIGSIVATLLPIPVALIQFDSTWLIIGVIAIPGAVQLIVGNAIEPLVMGEGLDLHPLTVLLALVFWGLIWGPVGMLLAAPITAVLRIVLSRIELTRPVAEIMAGRFDPEAGPEPAH